MEGLTFLPSSYVNSSAYDFLTTLQHLQTQRTRCLCIGKVYVYAYNNLSCAQLLECLFTLLMISSIHVHLKTRIKARIHTHTHTYINVNTHLLINIPIPFIVESYIQAGHHALIICMHIQVTYSIEDKARPSPPPPRYIECYEQGLREIRYISNKNITTFSIRNCASP